MVFDTALLNTQQYKVRIKRKVDQFRERSGAPSPHLGVVAIEKGAFWWPLTTVTNYYYHLFYLRYVYIFESQLLDGMNLGKLFTFSPKFI